MTVAAAIESVHPELGAVGAESRRERFELLKARLNAAPAVLPAGGFISTAVPELDRLLEGGFPLGGVATLEGVSGAWSLAAGILASTTRRGLVAILDDGGLYPPALVEAGVSLERVLVIPAGKALAAARAADILLRARICRLILMPAVAVRGAVWERLATLAYRSGALLIVVVAHAGAALSAAAVVRLHCTLERILMRGRSGLWGSIDGFELSVDVRKYRCKSAGRTTRVRVDREERDAALR